MSKSHFSNDTTFSNDEWLRYTRHLQLPGFGVNGQTKLKNAHVLIVGMGGLGSPVSLYLAAAGVGKMTMIDGDTVDITNLQRQVIYSTLDITKPKVATAREKLTALNPEITIDTIDQHFSTTLIDTFSESFIQSIDLVLDCTDNFSTRYLINDFCLVHKLPWVYASIHQFSGQCALFTPNNACFRCVFPEAPVNAEDCNTGGVIGVLPGLLGLIQANETIKFLAGITPTLENHLMLFDAKSLKLQKIQLSQSPDCECSKNLTQLDSNNKDYQFFCTTNTEEPSNSLLISPEVFHKTRDNENIIVLDVRSGNERKGFHIGGVHLSIDDILSDNFDSLDQNKSYYCYCQTGIRSEKAAVALKQKGYDVKSLKGGLSQLLKEKTNT